MCEDRLLLLGASATAAAAAASQFIFILRLQQITKQKYKCQQICIALIDRKTQHTAIYMHEFSMKNGHLECGTTLAFHI